MTIVSNSAYTGKIKKFHMEYKGNIGSIDYSNEDEVFHGKLEGISDLVTYEAADLASLEAAFHEAIDDYLARKDKLVTIHIQCEIENGNIYLVESPGDEDSWYSPVTCEVPTSLVKEYQESLERYDKAKSQLQDIHWHGIEVRKLRKKEAENAPVLEAQTLWIAEHQGKPVLDDKKPRKDNA